MLQCWETVHIIVVSLLTVFLCHITSFCCMLFIGLLFDVSNVHFVSRLFIDSAASYLALAHIRKQDSELQLRTVS